MALGVWPACKIKAFLTFFDLVVGESPLSAITIWFRRTGLPVPAMDPKFKLRVGSTVNGYLLEKTIKCGNFGLVYAARRITACGEPRVALKVRALRVFGLQVAVSSHHPPLDVLANTCPQYPRLLTTHCCQLPGIPCGHG